MEILKNKYKRKNDKLILILHEQNIGTIKLESLSNNIVVWCSPGKLGFDAPNKGYYFKCYSKIIEYEMDRSNWLNSNQFQIKNHTIKSVDFSVPGYKSCDYMQNYLFNYFN